MRYIVIDRQRNGEGDWFTEEFEDREKAISKAEYGWNHLADREKKGREILVLESVNPDEDADNHFDGTPIWEGEI